MFVWKAVAGTEGVYIYMIPGSETTIFCSKGLSSFKRNPHFEKMAVDLKSATIKNYWILFAL